MANTDTLKSKLDNIANSIREQLEQENNETNKMTLDEMPEKIKEIQTKQYNELWDRIIGDGQPQAYRGVFSGRSWNDETFNPPLDDSGVSKICPHASSINNTMFQYSLITNINFDPTELSNIENNQMLTDEEKIAQIVANCVNRKHINFYKTSQDNDQLKYPSPQGMFQNANNLENLSLFLRKTPRLTYSQTFGGCTNLRNLFILNDADGIESTWKNAKAINSGYPISLIDCPLSRLSIIQILLNINPSFAKTLTFNENAIIEAFGENYYDDLSYDNIDKPEGNYTWKTLMALSNLDNCTIVVGEYSWQPNT